MTKTKEIPQFDYKGIKKITIPCVDEDFSASNGYGWSIIKRYLPTILTAHQKNEEKITYLYNYFLGEQDIEFKKRKRDADKDNNNKEVENHAYRQVEFKVGFLCGEIRDYAHKSDSKSNDLKFLDRYFTDCKFFQKDANLKEWIYSVGLGVTETKPRVDIITTDIDVVTQKSTSRYLTAAEGYNVEYESPFEFECVDPRNNFVVYSSASGEKPIFCVKYVDVDVATEKDDAPIIKKQLLVETRYAYFKFLAESNFGVFYWNTEKDVTSAPKSIRYLPLLEFSVNKDRIGIVEKNRSAFNTINLFRSATNDMVIDNANSLLVFKNVDIDEETIQDMIKAGAVILKDSATGAVANVADLKNITIEIPYDKMAVYVDQVTQNAYDIVGVPMASGQTTSGGDTGQARLLGGGWNNAYIVINKEKLFVQGTDYDQLKLFLMLCQQVPDSPIKNLYASDIDINYRVNQNDNLQVKAQSMKYMYDMNMPLEFILKAGGLSNDIKTDSANWQANIDRANALAAQLEASKSASSAEDNSTEEGLTQTE